MVNEDLNKRITDPNVLQQIEQSVGGASEEIADNTQDEKSLMQGIKLANTLRQAASVEELYYSPSLRETIAYSKLISGNMSPKKAAEIVFGNVYAQWGNIELQKVNDIIASMYES